MLCREIQLQISCDTFCLTDNEQYLFGICCKKSILFKYQVDNGKFLEKLFLGNLSPPFIQATTDRLILSRKTELILMSISEKDVSPLKR
jgi:hypothetical protein